MKMQRRTFISGAAGTALVAGLAGWAPQHAFAATELPNPGFESVTAGLPDDWAPFTPDTPRGTTIVQSPVHGGSNALKLKSELTESMGWRSAKVPAEAGKVYEVAIHTLIESGKFSLYLEFWNASGTRIHAQYNELTHVGSWDLARLRAEAPSGTTAVSLLAYSAKSQAGVAYFDDASISVILPRVPELFGTAAFTAAVRGGTRVGDRIFFTSRYPMEGGPVRLGAVSLRTGELEYTIDVDLGGGSAGNTMTTDGEYAYIGSSGSQWIWRHKPGTDVVEKFVDLGASRWVYSMNVYEDHLYFGTYNDGRVRRARLSDGVIDLTYGRVSSSMYATGAAANSQYVFGGSSAPGTLLRWPREGGEPLDLTAHLSESPVGILDLLVTEDTIYAACGRYVVSMDLDGGSRVARDISEEDRYVDKLTIGPDGTVYAMARLTTNVYRVTDSALEKVARPVNDVENQFLGVAEDGMLVGVSGLGHVWWAMPGGEATVLDTAETDFAYPDEVQSMLLHSDGKVWVASHFAVTVHDVKAGTSERIHVNGEAKALVEGQGGKVYAAMYPSATLLEIDPTTLDVRIMGNIPGQMRTMDMNYDHRRKVLMIGTGPTSKRYDGALTFVDLKTGEFEMRQDYLPNQRVQAIAHDKQYAYIVGDAVGEGNATALEPVAQVACIDLDTRELVWHRALKADWLSYEDVVLDDGILYFMSRRPLGRWFSYDPVADKILDEGSLGGYGSFGYDKGRVYTWVHWALEIAELPSRKNESFKPLYSAVPNGWYNNPMFSITPNGQHTWGVYGSKLARFELTGRGKH